MVHVEADPRRPLAGAQLDHAGSTLGVTDAEGLITVRATGKEGERLELGVSCPDGYRSPEERLSVTLRRAAERPEYFVACPPLKRKLVIAARLQRGAGLPIRYLGRELGRSDVAGLAHLVVEAESEKTVELTIDTAEQPALRPKSPTASFRMGNKDELVLLEQAFQTRPEPAPRAKPAATGPVRIR